MPPVHGCLAVTLRHGWDQLHTRVSTTGVRKSLSRTRGPIIACLVSSMRERCCCISAASSPERCARGPRVGRASRSPCYRSRSRFHHQQMGVVFQLPVTDLQSPDELKSLQQSCIINQRLKAIGSTGWAALQKWNGC
jgi:hypothetical protein